MQNNNLGAIRLNAATAYTAESATAITVGSDGFTTYTKTFTGRGCAKRAAKYLATDAHVLAVVSSDELFARTSTAYHACFMTAN